MNWIQRIFCPKGDKIATLEQDIVSRTAEINRLLAENSALKAKGATLDFAFDSAYIKTLTGEQLNKILIAAFPKVAINQMKLADDLYQYTTLAEVQRWASFDPTNELKYRANQLDCDKFALTDMADFKKENNYQLGNGIFGICWGLDVVNGSGHAWNFAYVAEGLYFCEPQTDEIWKYGDVSKHNYAPDFIYI